MNRLLEFLIDFFMKDSCGTLGFTQKISKKIFIEFRLEILIENDTFCWQKMSKKRDCKRSLLPEFRAKIIVEKVS